VVINLKKRRSGGINDKGSFNSNAFFSFRGQERNPKSKKKTRRCEGKKGKRARRITVEKSPLLTKSRQRKKKKRTRLEKGKGEDRGEHIAYDVF